MDEHADERYEDEADEDFDSFEDAMDHFISNRLQLMEQTGTAYRTRDAFVAQTLLLVEIALLGLPDSVETLAETKAMVDKFSEDGWSPVSKPNAEWCRKVIKLAGEHIYFRRQAYEHEHHAKCPNCNPPENRNN
jgi:hypothetical protein